jgi:hypothetical protein
MTPEAMKKWEERLGPEKVQRAIRLVRSHGWGPRDFPPTWVWAEAFLQVESGKEVWGSTKPPSLLEGIFGRGIF